MAIIRPGLENHLTFRKLPVYYYYYYYYYCTYSLGNTESALGDPPTR